ncbi:MAG TPA: ABC transporter substrate-binding protein [Anaeromyxobacteraceae bacterium]|nr:ABC transporter substrate-binding protein [Anaeromyxobacteraceae bacterium]
MCRSAALAVAIGLLAACKQGAGDPSAPIRLGFFPNLTHAQALVGDAEGAFAKAAGAPVQTRQFNAGPAAMEALLAGDLDLCYVGPGPATIAHLRSQGEALRVIAGAASGGAVLAARTARAPGDLAGKRVASPQLGNTQDIALRAWLGKQGLAIGDGAGAVRVTPLANPDILALMKRGDLEAAWVPEPWGARLRAEASAHVLVDERDLWEGRRFPTTVLVASQRALSGRRAAVVALLRTHLALTARWKEDPTAFARAANAAYGRLAGHPLPEPVLLDAFSRLEPTSDPLAAQLAEGARRAQALRFAPPGDLDRLVDRSLLEEALHAAAR